MAFKGGYRRSYKKMVMGVIFGLQRKEEEAKKVSQSTLAKQADSGVWRGKGG